MLEYGVWMYGVRYRFWLRKGDWFGNFKWGYRK